MSKQHPAINKFYEIWVGGIPYSGQCEEVLTDNSEQTRAWCRWMNGQGPGSSPYFSVEVDADGNQING